MPPRPRQRPPRRLRLLLSVAAVVLTLDVVTKVIAVKLLPPGQPVSIIGDTVTWTLVRNSGAAFSMATGYTWSLTLIATGVVVGIFWMGRRLVSPWWAVGLGMILGGAMGNLVDRFFRAPGPLRGHVVDFLSVGWWPVFNVADPAVVGGAILLVVLSILGYDFDAVSRRKADGTPTVGAGPTSADGRTFDARSRGAGGHARRRGTRAAAGTVPQRRGGHRRRGRRRARRSPGREVRPVEPRRMAAGAPARGAGAAAEHARRHRGHGDPLLRRRHRRRRQARGGGRARVGGLDGTDRARRPGRRRLPDHHLGRARAAGHRAPPRRGHLRGDGGRAVRARIHRAEAGVQVPHGRQALPRAGAGTSRTRPAAPSTRRSGGTAAANGSSRSPRTAGTA